MAIVVVIVKEALINRHILLVSFLLLLYKGEYEVAIFVLWECKAVRYS